MSDVVVTVPKTFTHPAAPGKVGLAAWIAEGDAAGDPPGSNFLHKVDVEWEFAVYGAKPGIVPGERVYVVCEGRLRGFAPLMVLRFAGRAANAPRLYSLGRCVFVRKGGAVAVTIPEPITGFRGWRYRWWDRSIEVPFPDWKTP